MKLNKIASAVSISLAALALTACGGSSKSNTTPVVNPSSTSNPSVSDAEKKKISELIDYAVSKGLTSANAAKFAQENKGLALNSPELNAALEKAIKAQDAATAGNQGKDNPISNKVDESNPFVDGYDRNVKTSVSADHYARQSDSNFDRAANKENTNGSSGLSTTLTTNKQNPYLTNFVLGSESFSEENGKPKQDAVDVIGRVVYADGSEQTINDAKKEPTYFDYPVSTFNRGQKDIKAETHHQSLQYVNRSNVEIGETHKDHPKVAKVTTNYKDDLTQKHSIDPKVSYTVTVQLLDEKDQPVTISQLRARAGNDEIKNIDDIEKKYNAAMKNAGTHRPLINSQAVLDAVASHDVHTSVDLGAKTVQDKNVVVKLKTDVEYNVDPQAGLLSGLVAYNTKSSLPIYGIEENAYKLAGSKLVVQNPDSPSNDVANNPYRALDIENALEATGRTDTKLPAVANNFTTRIFGKNYRAYENGKTIESAKTSNNSYMAQYGSDGTVSNLTEMKLHNVQYGRITTNIDVLAKDRSDKLDYIARRYEEHGAPTTVDKYFYRGTNETTQKEMAEVIKSAKGKKLEYRGHALTYNLGPVPSEQGRTELPTAYGSVRVATIGNFVQASYDTGTGKIEGSIYNLKNEDLRDNSQLSGYKKQDLATFTGDVVGNTAIGTSAKVGTSEVGAFTGSFFGGNAEELGGQISSISRNIGYGEPKWGAVFGATKIGANGSNYDTSSVISTTK